MQQLEHDDVAPFAESDHEAWDDHSNDYPALDDRELLAYLEADEVAESSKDTFIGIGNGIIGGSLIWAIAASIVFLFA